MKGINLIILFVILFAAGSCSVKELNPATEIVYEGPLAGNSEMTYASAQKVVERCIQAKICMGLGEYDYPLPMIRGMSGGNAVTCGDSLKRGCYTTDGYITVVQGGDIDIISHECVHHWLYVHTGDLDPEHESVFFLKCGDIGITGDIQ